MKEFSSLSAKSKKPWKLFIDTGGTFTDCLAVDPNEKEHRCKVLSSSSIRGLASASGRSDSVHIQLEEFVPDEFFTGFTFFLLDEPDSVFTVNGFDAEKSLITLDRELQRSGKWNLPFELQSPEEAPILGARILTKTPGNQNFPPMEMRLSTTKGTNALLERGGAKTLFLITEGFRDLLNIKNQQRPDLFTLNIHKSNPYCHHIIEVPERIDAKGKIIKPLDVELLKQRLDPLSGKYEAAGICLMNSYQNNTHENQVEELLRNKGMTYLSVSSALSPEIKIVPRAVTTDVNSYLTPIMEKYLTRISGVIGGQTLWVMSSGGNLVKADHYKPMDGLLSGPAGGVIGAAVIGKRSGNEKIISFDMGGTSTDVARFDGKIDYVYEHSVGEATLTAPAVEIETVAAGGGSVCGFDGLSLTVGPESAGADPGPACYGRGGPLTITDVNLLSGRLSPSNFHISIVKDAAERRLEEIITAAAEANQRHGKETAMGREQILKGFLDIANERMAQAIRKISIQKGFDPAEYAMVAFGGAGAQHALAIAEKLKINSVLVPSDAGLLSAYGLQKAQLEQIATRQVLKPLEDVKSSLYDWFDEIISQAKNGLKNQGIPEEEIEITRQNLFLRLKGQDTSLEIDFTNAENIEESFKKTYKDQYGHWIEDRDIEVEAIRLKVSEVKKPEKVLAIEEGKKKAPLQEVEPDSDHRQNKIYTRSQLHPGTKLVGPSLILDPYSTTVIEPGWEGVLLNDGTWLIERNNHQNLSKRNSGSLESDTRSEAVNLQLYTNRFRSVADQMGEMLRKTSMSVNVKERLDFSCALLDADGYLVVNAPHIPVHLGAMGTCVRTLIKSLKEFEEDDVIVTNHPGFGGSHLPDVTVVTPVFFDGNRIGFTASRAHHAEIGGKSPGSMPPNANNLAEEGVVIPPTFIARGGDFDWNTIKNLLQNSLWPTRSLDENLADLQAAVAANYRGAEELKKLAHQFGVSEVTDYMVQLKMYAAERMRATLKVLEDGSYHAEEKMDDGSLLAVSCKVKGESVTIDFTGTSGVNSGNLNANPSIVNSVVMYVLRLMIDEPLPLNDGLFEPVKLIIPRGMLNPEFPEYPKECPAVVGGNIETSQRLVDTLLKAFGLSACSYGTMNNVLFGNDSFGYYETVAGGTGAGNGFHGADAVHQHMTNTRATDPEILEHRYPVRLDRYSIRRNSGGDGKWTGGNGMIREFTFLEPVSLSVLTQHRVIPPYGLQGGGNGKTGKQWIVRKNGSKKNLNWRDGAELEEGDRFVMQTPGGGGFGKSTSEK